MSETDTTAIPDSGFARIQALAEDTGRQTPDGPQISAEREPGDFRSSDVQLSEGAREERREQQDQAPPVVVDENERREAKEGDAPASHVQPLAADAQATEGAAIFSPADGSIEGAEASGELTAVHVVQHGDLWRVAEVDGTWAGPIRARADGGGFKEERTAQHLAATINERRQAAGRF